MLYRMVTNHRLCTFKDSEVCSRLYSGNLPSSTEMLCFSSVSALWFYCRSSMTIDPDISCDLASAQFAHMVAVVVAKKKREASSNRHGRNANREKENRCNDDDDIEQGCLCVHNHIQFWHNTRHPMEQFNSSTAWDLSSNTLPLMTCTFRWSQRMTKINKII